MIVVCNAYNYFSAVFIYTHRLRECVYGCSMYIIPCMVHVLEYLHVQIIQTYLYVLALQYHNYLDTLCTCMGIASVCMEKDILY